MQRKSPHEQRTDPAVYRVHDRTVSCCARYRLSQEPDFLGQREWLREVVEDAGHKIIYYPKFHCELNYIEMAWAYLKSYLRRNCAYTFSDLEEKIDGHLHEIVPIAFIRRAARHCYRFMACYRQGLEGKLADIAMKKYSSHKRITKAQADEVVAQAAKPLK